jgi:ABC-type phosphate/phosphonate transport system substrate-binding protein
MKKLAVVLIAFAFAACGKSDETAPVVSVITPTDNQVFANGATVNVKADISDETGIHMVHLIVVDNNGLHIDHFEEHLDGKTYTLNRSFTAQSGKSYTITVDATDHGDNTTTKNLHVSAN